MKGKFSASNPETLTREIAALAGASRANLTSRWRVLYDTEPPLRVAILSTLPERGLHFASGRRNSDEHHA